MRTLASDCQTIAIYEYTPFCNGPGAELTLVSVVGAEAATTAAPITSGGRFSPRRPGA
jgi:hypothetical protein